MCLVVQIQEVKNTNHVTLPAVKNVKGKFLKGSLFVFQSRVQSNSVFSFSDIPRSSYTVHHEPAESVERGQKPKEEGKDV